MNKTQDRKTKHFDELLNVNGELLRVNSGHNRGVYTEIVKRFTEQLDIALSLHRRLLVHRLDLHTTYYSPNNKIISRFMNRIKQWIKRNYGIQSIGYIWAREQERSKHQHYHLAIMLDGDKIRHPKKLNEKLKEMWSPHGHMPVISKPYYYIDKHNREQMRGEAIYRVSYLAKVRGKGNRDPQAKDYQTSRLRLG